MEIPVLNNFKRAFNASVWYEVAATILARHQIEYSNLKRAEHGENIVFLIEESLVLKIYTPVKNGFHREKAGLEFAARKTSIPIPEIIDEGEIEGYYYLVMTQFDGELMTKEMMTKEMWYALEKREQVI